MCRRREAPARALRSGARALRHLSEGKIACSRCYSSRLIAARESRGICTRLRQRRGELSVLFVKQNIETKGRVARACFGGLLLLAAGCLAPSSGVLAGIFVAAAIFTIFEAFRGWCAFRACGIKTPL